MTIEEIFSQLSAHMIEGLMVHSQMADYYGFLGLEGYQKCHKYHYFEENCNYKKLGNYYLKHYNKIIPDMPFKNPDIIPDSWFNYKRQDVNAVTRKNAIQIGMEKWVDWEKQTKNLYESLYQELINLNEIAAANELRFYIEDVDYELAFAEQLLLKLTAMDYDIVYIMDVQDDLLKEHEKKLGEINLC